jgi:hypothetical protein
MAMLEKETGWKRCAMLKPEKGGIPWQNLSLNCPSEANGRLDGATSSLFYNPHRQARKNVGRRDI